MDQNYSVFYSGFKNLLLLICGPSGVGKSTLIESMNFISNLYSLSISSTTRDPAIHPIVEVHGKHYYFIKRDEFLQQKERGEFAETNPFMEGDLYGTPWPEFTRIRELGKTPAFDIDINGVCQLDKIIPRQLTYRIFLDVTENEQRKRLEKRNRDTPAKIEKRIAFAHKERVLLKQLLKTDPGLFDVVVDYNDKDPNLYANELVNKLMGLQLA